MKSAAQGRCCLSCLLSCLPTQLVGLWALARSGGTCAPLSQGDVDWMYCSNMDLLDAELRRSLPRSYFSLVGQ